MTGTVALPISAGRLSKGMVNEHLRTSGISSSSQNSVSIIPSKLPVSGSSSAHSSTWSAAHGYAHLVVLHGDDQGAIADLLPILNDDTYKKYDCCLGSRFMKGSKTGGYSALRTWGNYGFNWLFSLVARRKITDLGSGLNLYDVASLKNGYYKKFPDTLYFNDCMILAQCQLKQKVLFFPISWREEDQVSNNKLTSFGISLLKLCGRYLRSPRAFVEREWRTTIIDDYTYTEIPVQQ